MTYTQLSKVTITNLQILLRMKQLFMDDNEAYVLTGTSYNTIFNEFEQSYKEITLHSLVQIRNYE